ncbi:nucleoside-diphosphate kinase [Candidatus Micrarchaeota archaeon CG10_big_fil_rev_8_21_14_0_10_59_7]|nr:MAG: nucleoside-diphosphate kinase [Candidatus Micrarchaeota archaeon CG10_big_fil_rev_8_21_14_0_10_59_7]
MEKTFVMLKPDAVQRGLVGEITARFERKGLRLAGAKMIWLKDSQLDEHYSQYLGKEFFPRLKEFMGACPVLAMVWEGKDAVKVVRTLCGLTNGREALPGTIRGDYGMSLQCNLVHASDSLQTAEREISRFFAKEELFAYGDALSEYRYAKDER